MINEIINNGLSAFKLNQINDDSRYIELTYLPLSEEYEYDHELLVVTSNNNIILLKSGDDTYDSFLYLLSLPSINIESLAVQEYIRGDTLSCIKPKQGHSVKTSEELYVVKNQNGQLTLTDIYTNKHWVGDDDESMSKFLYLLSLEFIDDEVTNDFELTLC